MSLIAIPFLTRLYSAESFGVFAAFYALTSIIGMVSTLRLDQALPIIEEVKERISLARLSILRGRLVQPVFYCYGLSLPLETGSTHPWMRGLAYP